MTRLPENARSECVAPSVLPFGGVVESMRMFHAACAASQRPGLSPTRGSGVGGVADTMGATGGGITAGGGGGGGGGVPRPPRPAASSPAGGVAGGSACSGGAAVGAAAAGGVAAGGAAVGCVAGGVFVPELAHPGTPNVPAANNTVASRPLISSNCVLLIGCSPASRSSV